jgi:enoyl-CoA hydratase
VETIKLLRQGAVAIVRLARPPVNAVNRQMTRELYDCFVALGEDREVGTVVLSAEGDRVFCAGVDMKERVTEEEGSGRSVSSVHDAVDAGWSWRETQRVVRHCPVPVIAAVDGAAIGAGFGLVGVTDIIVASERASFGLTEINIGLLGGSSKALRMVGPFKARMMFFSGDLVPAQEFYRLGAVEMVVPSGTAETRAVEIAERFAKKSPIALRLAKESIIRIESMPVEDAYRTEQDYTQRLRSYNDSREAMRAYLEKRDPQWTWS